MKRLLLGLASLLLMGAANAAVYVKDGFEAGLGAPWSVTSGVAVTSTRAHTGTKAMEITWNGGANTNQRATTNTHFDASSYYFSGWWYGQTGFFWGNAGAAGKKFIEFDRGEYLSRLLLQMEGRSCNDNTHTRAKQVVVNTQRHCSPNTQDACSSDGECTAHGGTCSGSYDLNYNWNQFPSQTGTGACLPNPEGGGCTLCPPGGYINTANPADEVIVTSGAWYHFEYQITQTGPSAHGVGARLQMWINGALQIDVAGAELGVESDSLALAGDHHIDSTQTQGPPAQKEWWDDICVATTSAECSGTPGDLTAPDAITNLSIGATTPTSAILQWSAPADR